MATKRRLVLILIAGLSLGACNRTPPHPEVRNDEPGGNAQVDTSAPSSVISMNDPKTAKQLITGFYSVENAWRWTGRTFSASLATPPGAGQSGARVALKFSVPDALIKSGPVTLSASADGLALKSEVYQTPGGNTFLADLPPNLLTGQSVQIDFSLDHAIPPNPSGDRRELGIIAVSLGITAK